MLLRYQSVVTIRTFSIHAQENELSNLVNQTKGPDKIAQKNDGMESYTSCTDSRELDTSMQFNGDPSHLTSACRDLSVSVDRLVAAVD